jgi:DNA-binding NarL/FixJ family response regulator
MPIMNCLEEARVLKKLRPNVPVIVFTAFSEPILAKEAGARRVSAIISTPEPITVLIAARSLLDQVAA